MEVVLSVLASLLSGVEGERVKSEPLPLGNLTKTDRRD